MRTEMDEKLIITRHNSCIMTFLLSDGNAKEISIEPENANHILGNIYIGRVQNIVSNIQAAFIEIESGLPCYYSIEDNQTPIYTSKINSPRLVAGDELLVQVSKENVKTKAPTVTCNLSFSGKYLVLTSGKKQIGVSTKLSDDKKKELRTWIAPYESMDYGWIIRTNARDASMCDLVEEAKHLIEHYERIIGTAKYRTCFSCLYSAPKRYLMQIRDTYTQYLQTILTDDRVIFQELESFMKEYQPEDLGKLSFYEDPLLPMHKLYNLEKSLEEALKERIWLKSGGYLVIQPTEALTSIDINTGKFDGKRKNQEETFLKINLEAAREIARQLRLRNISGIIIVDFINLKLSESRQILMDTFHRFLEQDPIKTVLIDMTALDLVEVTRKKVRRTLAEQQAACLAGIQRK